MMTMAVGALVVVAWWVTHSAIFRAHDISVEGNHRLSDRAVLRLAEIGPATDVVWLSTGRVEARLGVVGPCGLPDPERT